MPAVDGNGPSRKRDPRSASEGRRPSAGQGSRSGASASGERNAGRRRPVHSAGGSNGSSSDTVDSNGSNFFNANSDGSSSDTEIYAVSLGWRKPTPVHPPGWKLVVRPRAGSYQNPLDPRCRVPVPLHQRIDPRLKPKCRTEPILIPLERSKKRSRHESNDPRSLANKPIKAPKAERMSANERMAVREKAKTAPTGLLRDIMTGFNKLQQVIAPSNKINQFPSTQSPAAKTPDATTPASPKKPKGSRNVPKCTNRVQATNDPNSKRPRAPKMKMRRTDRPVAKRVKLSKRLVSSSSEGEDEANRNRLIAGQMNKFKVRKSAKRLNKRHLDANKNKVKTGKNEMRKLSISIVRLSEYSSSTDDVDIRSLFDEDNAGTVNNNNNNNNNNSNFNDSNSKGMKQQASPDTPNISLSTRRLPPMMIRMTLSRWPLQARRSVPTIFSAQIKTTLTPIKVRNSQVLVHLTF